MDYKKLAEHYETMIGVMQQEQEANLKLSKRILSAKSNILGVMIEVRSYRLKKGNSDKLDGKLDMYSEIYDCLDVLGQLEQSNHDLQLLSKLSIQEKNHYKNKCALLEEKIKQIEKFYEGR